MPLLLASEENTLMEWIVIDWVSFRGWRAEWDVPSAQSSDGNVHKRRSRKTKWAWRAKNRLLVGRAWNFPETIRQTDTQTLSVLFLLERIPHPLITY